MAFVTIHEEVSVGRPDDWRLCFQYVTYNYENDSPPERGYRFIWRKPNGHLQGARGQARIPDAATHERLIAKAATDGWYVRAEDRTYQNSAPVTNRENVGTEVDSNAG